MGGFSYDRDDYDSSSSSGWSSSSSYSSNDSYSSYASSKMSAFRLDDSMKPTHRIRSNSKNPIIIVLDVTGSNTSLAKIVYDKMPMFYGQIEQQGYLKDFDICFMAVGDAFSDKYPLQVGNFAKGIEIDTYLEKIVLEGCGGGNDGESYELAAYYLTHYMDLPEGAKPIVFFQGDEPTHGNPTKSSVEEVEMNWNADSGDVWKNLREMCDDNVYMMLGKFNGTYWKESYENEWKNILADEHVIRVNEEKAIIDLILGIISMVSQTRDLDSYKVDMLNRGQTTKRIEDVSNSLKNLSTALAVVNVQNGAVSTTAPKKTGSKGKRL